MVTRKCTHAQTNYYNPLSTLGLIMHMHGEKSYFFLNKAIEECAPHYAFYATVYVQCEHMYA